MSPHTTNNMSDAGTPGNFSNEEITLSATPDFIQFDSDGGGKRIQVSTNARYFKINMESVETYPWATPDTTDGEGPGGSIYVLCGLNEGDDRYGTWTIQAYNDPSDFDTEKSVKKTISILQDGSPSSDSSTSRSEEWEFGSDSSSSNDGLPEEDVDSSSSHEEPTSSIEKPDFTSSSAVSSSCYSSDSSSSEESSSSSSSVPESSSESSSESSESSGSSSSEESSFSSDVPSDGEPDCRSEQCQFPCDEECTEGNADVAQAIPISDPEESGMCGSTLVIGNPVTGGAPQSRARSAGMRAAGRNVNVYCDAPMEAKASFDNDGNITLMNPSGTIIPFPSQRGGDGSSGAPGGTSSTNSSLVQYIGPNGTPIPAGEAKTANVVSKDGSSRQFDRTTGNIISMRTAKGAVITAEQYRSKNAITRDNAGNISSIWNDKSGMLTLSQTNNKLTVNKYAPNQISSDASGAKVPSGSPIREYSYETFIEGNASVMKIVNKVAGQQEREIERRIEGNTTTIIVGKGTERIVTTYERKFPASRTMEEIKTVTKGLSAMPYSRVMTRKYYSELGWQTLSRTEGYGTGDERTTTWIYNDKCLVQQEKRPDGSSTQYAYDDKGRVTTEISPWGGTACSKIIRTTYADQRFNDHRPASIRTIIRDPYNYEREIKAITYTYEDSDQVNRVTTSVASAGEDAPRVSIVETWGENAPCSYASGRVKMEQATDGTQTFYTYEGSPYAAYAWKVTEETRVNNAAVPGRSERTVKWISAAATVARKEEYVHTGEGWSLVSTEDYEYDAEQRLTKTTRGNGRVSTTEWMCCGPRRQVDEDGVVTEFEYDSARKLVAITRSATETMPETITSFIRDGLGRAITTRIDAGPMTTTTSRTYDILGRLTTETDELGRTTRYSYSKDDLTITKTLPSGATEITVKNSDGTLREESGTGRRAISYSYYPSSDGAIQEVYAMTPSRERLKRTVVNTFGDTTREELPTTQVNVTLDSVYSYNAAGQIVQTRVGSMAPTLYEYDDMGTLSKKTLALGDQPTIRNSAITETSRQYKLIDGEVYREMTQVSWDADGNSLTEVQHELISQMSPTLDSKVIMIDARGTSSETWTDFSAPRKRTRFTRIPASDNTACEIIKDGFVVQSTDFAGITTTTEYSRLFDLPVKITDTLGKTICYAYDNRGCSLRHHHHIGLCSADRVLLQQCHAPAGLRMEPPRANGVGHRRFRDT